jgi:hypothetical protein
MATSTLEVCAPPGQTLFAELYDMSANRNTIVQTIALTEYATNLGTYYGNVVDLVTDVYTVRVRDAGGTTFGNGYVLDHTNAIGIELVKENAFATVTLTDEDIDDIVNGVVAGIGGGSGARAVTITVNDGVNPLESACIRLTKGAESYTRSTNAAGVTSPAFTVDDGTWAVVITLMGYTFTGTTLVVNGDETQTYSMTQVAISVPALPNCTTGYAVCIGTDGLPEEGVVVQAQMTAGPGTAGYIQDRGVITMTSDAVGYIEHTGFVHGAKYRFRRGSDSWGVAHLAPSANNWALDEFLGKD